MTPTERDKELREALGNVILGYGHAKIKSFEAACNEAMQLITADRKRVALEARLDELIWSTGVTYKYDEDRQIVQDRIAELKAKQEEVK